MKNLLFFGDTHGVFNTMRETLLRLRPDAAFVAGDFGYWKKRDFDPKAGRGFRHDELRTLPCPVFFCDGNHENFRLLRRLTKGRMGGGPVRVRKNLYYMPRGSVLELFGRRILFVGGAYSIDKALRVPGKTWFEEETLTAEETETILRNLPHPETIDTVISHTCPECCLDEVCKACSLRPEWVRNTVTEQNLQVLCERLPAVRDWYFGHWHAAAEFTLPGRAARFHLLAMMPRKGAVRLEKLPFGD